jgi:cell division protease FtsH
MLVEMDGFEENSGVIVVAATNRPDVLDPALLRAGRFDRQVVVDVPDVKGREEILQVHTKNLPLADDVHLETIAKGTPGFVGADLANLVNEAALLAARFEAEKVSMIDFEEAKDKIAMGTERKSMVLSEKERKMTAYHEAGHAICTLHCENADPLHKVTIIPRGRALGITYSVPEEDKHSYSKDYLLDRICVAMGGRAAEKIVFDNFTTGAANDIKVSTDLVRKMVCEYGMSEAGPIALGAKEEEAYLGYEMTSRNYSEKMAEEIDRLVKGIILKQEERSIKILTEHRAELDLLAEALIEHELLDKEEIDKIISGTGIERAKKSRDKDLAPIDMRAWATTDKVEISSEGENISTSRKHFDETAKQNEQIIEGFERRIAEEEDIILILEAKVAEEEKKTPPDRKKIKSFLESIKSVQKKIKFYRKNIKIADDIIYLAEGASLLLEEANAADHAEEKPKKEKDENKE